MKDKIIIYSNHPKSLLILTDLLKLHSHQFEMTDSHEHLINAHLPNARCLIVDAFITNKITGMDFIRKNIKKIDVESIFLFRTHQLTSDEEEFVSEYKINLLPKPIFPLMIYKRLSQVLKL